MPFWACSVGPRANIILFSFVRDHGPIPRNYHIYSGEDHARKLIDDKQEDESVVNMPSVIDIMLTDHDIEEE